MDALRTLLKSPSLRSGETEENRNDPDKVLNLRLEYLGRHRKLVSFTSIGIASSMFGRTDISLTRQRKNPIMRALYFVVTVQKVRLLHYHLLEELGILHSAVKEQGLLTDPDMPSQLLEFLHNDDALKRWSKVNDKSSFNETFVEEMARQVLGLAALFP